MIDNLSRTFSCLFKFLKIIMKLSTFSVVTTKSSGICAYIYMITFFIIGNTLHIIMYDRIPTGSHVICKSLTLPVQTINPTTVSTNPEVMLLIFHHLSHNGKTQSPLTYFFIRIILKYVFRLIKIIDSTVIRPYPNSSLIIFI